MASASLGVAPLWISMQPQTHPNPGPCTESSGSPLCLGTAFSYLEVFPTILTCPHASPRPMAWAASTHSGLCFATWPSEPPATEKLRQAFSVFWATCEPSGCSHDALVIVRTDKVQLQDFCAACFSCSWSSTSWRHRTLKVASKKNFPEMCKFGNNIGGWQ